MDKPARTRSIMLTVGVAVAVALGFLLAGPSAIDSVPFPQDSLLAGEALGADYVDTFRMRVGPGAFPDVASLDAIAFQKGELVFESQREIVYRGNAPGLVFWVRYATEPEAVPPAVEMSTVVRYLDRKGRFYFTLVRPIHRVGVPWILRRRVEGVRR